MIKKIILLILTLYLAGCGAMVAQKYVEPNSRNYATVEFVNNTNGTMAVQVQSESVACKGRTIVDPIEPGHRKSIKIDSAQLFTYANYLTAPIGVFGERDLLKEPKVPAKKHQGFAVKKINPVVIYKPIDQCIIQNTFKPKNGAMYLIEAKTIKGEFCTNEVFSYINRVKKPLKIVEREYLPPAFEDSEMCTPVPNIRSYFR